MVVKYHLLAWDIAQQWADRGHEVCLISPSDIDLPKMVAVKGRGFQLVFGINYSPELSEVCRQVGLKYVSWTIDPLEEKRWPTVGSEHEVIFCFRRRWCRVWAARTLREVHYLPLAATSNRQPPGDEPGELFELQGLWVGSSCSQDWQRHPMSLREWYGDHQVTVDDWISERLTSLDSSGGLLDGEVDLGSLSEVTQMAPDRWEALIDDLTAFRGRVGMMSRLSESPIHLWGDVFWKRLGNSYQGFAEHGDFLTGLYAKYSLTLDIPRWYQADIVTMRVFDSMASGGAVLTFSNDDVMELFYPGVHLETYSSVDEFEEKAKQLMTDRQRCKQLRRSGKAFVDRFHRVTHRLDSMEATLEEQGIWESLSSVTSYSAAPAVSLSGST